MAQDNNPRLDERCTRFQSCGVMRQAGMRVRDSGDYYLSARGSTHPPCERLVTIGGRLLLDQPVQKVCMMIEEVMIMHCADANATIKMKCLGQSSSRIAISPEYDYTICGLTRNWCTTTYILLVYLDDQAPIRHSIHLQGIESINQREPWQESYDIKLTTT